MLLDKREPPNVKISSVGYYKATLDTVPKSKVGSFGFVGMFQDECATNLCMGMHDVPAL